MTRKLPPIAQGWEKILARAPSDEQRKHADEQWRILFYAGADWLWNVYCRLDGKAELEEFVDALEDELRDHHKKAMQQFSKLKGVK